MTTLLSDGYANGVPLLINRSDVDPSAEGNYAIVFSSYKGHTEMVRFLLTHPKVDPTIRNNYCIKFASLNGYPDVVRLLLSRPDVDPTIEDNIAIPEHLTNYVVGNYLIGFPFN